MFAKDSWPRVDRQLSGALKNFTCNLFLCAKWLKTRITGIRKVYNLSPILCRKFGEKNVMANLDSESAKDCILSNDIQQGSSLIVLRVSLITILPFIPFVCRTNTDGTKQRGR